MIYLITGTSGYVASYILKQFLKEGHTVIGIDRVSSKEYRKLKEDYKDKFHFHKLNILSNELKTIFNSFDIDTVFHYAGNPDSRLGIESPTTDIEDNLLATINLLNNMKKNGVKKIVYASTANIYWKTNDGSDTEISAGTIQGSTYSAAKASCESFISSYCELYDFKSWILRYATMIGGKNNKTHIADFYRQLIEDPTHLKCLSDGSQIKNFIHVEDAVSATIHIYKNTFNKVNVFNVCTDETISLKESISLICSCLNVSPEIDYKKASIGWRGDRKNKIMSNSKLLKMGWKQSFTIKQAIESNIVELRKESNKNT